MVRVQQMPPVKLMHAVSGAGRRAGQNCSLEQGQPPPLCYSGSVCDVDKICKYVLKAKCAGGGACLPGTVCDIRPDPSSRKRAYKLCHKPLGSSCRDDQDCVNGTICDTMKRCSIPQDESCQDQADMCMSGAKCKDGKCQCDKTRTRFRRDKCEGELGIVTGDCRELSPTCRDTMADCVGGTCQCGASFVPVREDLTCRRKDRFACFQNDSIPCSRGAVCDRGICGVNINQSCADQPTNCRDGAVCDFMKMCKVKPGGQCRSYGDCVAGSTCDQRYTCQCTVGVSLLNETTHICVPEAGRVGGECVISSDTDSLTCNATFTECNISTSQCQCQPGFIVDHVDFSCRKKPGGLCTDDAECAVGSICITGTCSVPLGEHCEQNGDCISDTVCDIDAVCKIDMHGSCSGSRQDFCRIGTACDWLHQCHRPVGDRCSLTLTAEGNVHSCVAGANCQDSVCTCDPEVSSDYGAVCKPHAGRFGSPCGTGTDGECTMPGTVCVNNMCVCDSGHSPDREFGCDENDTDSDASIGGKVVIAGIVAGGVLVAAAVALLIYRKMSHRQHSQQKDTYTERSRDVGDVITTEAETEEVTEAETEEVTEAETTEEVTETSNVDLDVSESEVDN
ncbi:uncharacterized protein LOC143278038 [Babylonia areolata]|uniref:uncharacterized protein LOC143278038 n=1 Tax=Babylonia areolata TaxID=304850 RepID=UPI003FCFB0BD